MSLIKIDQEREKSALIGAFFLLLPPKVSPKLPEPVAVGTILIVDSCRLWSRHGRKIKKRSLSTLPSPVRSSTKDLIGQRGRYIRVARVQFALKIQVRFLSDSWRLEVVRPREIIDGFDLQFVEAAFDGEIGGIAERGKIR